MGTDHFICGLGKRMQRGLSVEERCLGCRTLCRWVVASLVFLQEMGYLKLGEENSWIAAIETQMGTEQGCLFDVFFDMNKDGRQVIMQRKGNYNFMSDRSRGNS